MRDFTGITTTQLKEKIMSMANSELGEALNELISRQIDSYRKDADSVPLDGLHLLQGHISQLKNLQSLFQTKLYPERASKEN